MSYAGAAALQTAVYQRLLEDTAVATLVGAAIFDAVPPGTPPGTFVLIGPEEARDQSDASGGGAEHRFVVSVVSDEAGFQTAKSAAAAISDALVDAPLSLSRGRLVGMRFMRAQARRTSQGALRRVDLTFRARIEE